MKWPWSKHNGKAERAVAAEAEYVAVRQQRPAVKKKARELAALPREELADRLRRAIAGDS